MVTASAAPLSARSTAKAPRLVAQPLRTDETAQPKTAVLSRLRRDQVSARTPHTGAATAIESDCSSASVLSADGPSCRSASSARKTWRVHGACARQVCMACVHGRCACACVHVHVCVCMYACARVHRVQQRG